MSRRTFLAGVAATIVGVVFHKRQVEARHDAKRADRPAGQADWIEGGRWYVGDDGVWYEFRSATGTDAFGKRSSYVWAAGKWVHLG